jgi:hypothetical protein
VLDHVVISPEYIELETDETRQFTAAGRDSANVTIEGVTYTWGVISGEGDITESGLFTAGSNNGTSIVQVIAEKDGIVRTATATVKVSSPPPDDDNDHRCNPPGWAHGNKKGWGGENTPPGWEHGNKKGWGGENTPPGWFEGNKQGWGGNDCSPGLSKQKMNGNGKGKD